MRLKVAALSALSLASLAVASLVTPAYATGGDATFESESITCVGFGGVTVEAAYVVTAGSNSIGVTLDAIASDSLEVTGPGNGVFRADFAAPADGVHTISYLVDGEAVATEQLIYPSSCVGAAEVSDSTPVVGSALTVDAGEWLAGTKLAYQWLANGTTISGAKYASYTPASTVVGRALSVRVTATLTGHAPVVRTSAVTSPVDVGTIITTMPTISDTTPTVGQKLTAKAAGWTAGTTLGYRWFANGISISGATKSTFTVTSSQRGKTITVRVTGKKAGFTTVEAFSVETDPVIAKFSSAPTPTISGSAKVGSTLKAQPGKWSPTATLTYQWFASGVAIPEATSSALALTTEHYGKRITVAVTGTRETYITATKVSASTATVGPRPAKITTNGTFPVGSRIAPGTYISSSSATSCYWERRSTAGSSFSGIIANDFGAGQRIVTIEPGDAYFYTSRCGSWSLYEPVGTSARTKTAASGIYGVGTSGGQLIPGTYSTPGSSGCYYARLSGFSGLLADIIENDFQTGGTMYVTIEASDLGFEASRCTWTRVG